MTGASIRLSTSRWPPTLTGASISWCAAHLSLVSCRRRCRIRLRAIDPDLPVFDVRTIDNLLSYQRWAERVFGSMFAIFAAIALTMASVGLYAVTAYAVSTAHTRDRLAHRSRRRRPSCVVARNAASVDSSGGRACRRTRRFHRGPAAIAASDHSADGNQSDDLGRRHRAPGLHRVRRVSDPCETRARCRSRANATPVGRVLRRVETRYFGCSKLDDVSTENLR